MWPYAVPRPRPLWYRASSSSTIGFLSACLLSLLLSLSLSLALPSSTVRISRPYVAPDLLLPLVRATDPVVVVHAYTCVFVCVYIYIWNGKETKTKTKTKIVRGWPRGERVIAAITGIKRRKEGGKEKDATLGFARERERERARVGGACSSADAAYGLYSNER